MLQLEALSHLRLPVVLDAVGCAVVDLDIRGTILGFNAEAERLHRCVERDVLGSRYIDLCIPHEFQSCVIGDVERAFNGGRRAQIEYPIMCFDGVCREVLWDLNRIDSSQGQTIIVAVGHDLTSSREREQRISMLEQRLHDHARQAELGALAAELLHDLGNPLTVLGLLAEQLARNAEMDPSVRLVDVVGRLRDIEVKLRAMAELIHDFKGNVRDSGAETEPVDLRDLLVNLVDAWRPAGVTRRIDLELLLPPSLSALHCRRPQLQRVCDNLIANAFEAIGTGPGRVVLRAACIDNACVRIEVSDTGTGGVARTDSDPFRPFHTTKVNGSGMGLTVVRRFAESSGGSVGYSRNHPRGMVFFFEVPLRR